MGRRTHTDPHSGGERQKGAGTGTHTQRHTVQGERGRRETERKTYGGGERHRERLRERDRERNTERNRDRQGETQGETETQRLRERYTERGRRETQKDRDRDMGGGGESRLSTGDTPWEPVLRVVRFGSASWSTAPCGALRAEGGLLLLGP